MGQRAAITATTAAITTKEPFTLKGADFTEGNPVVSVDGLAGAETVTFWKLVGVNWVPVADSAGTQVVFTATYPSDVFNGPGTYGITKTATVGAVVLYVDSGAR